MAVVPIILLLVAGAVIAAGQLTVQTDQLVPGLLMLVPLVAGLLLTLLLIGSILPALALARLRSLPVRLAAVRVRPQLRRGLP